MTSTTRSRWWRPKMAALPYSRGLRPRIWCMLIAWKRCFFRSEPSLPHLFFRASDVKLGPVPGKPLVQRMMRAASDWVDIQWTVVVTSLKSVAPRARGRLLDVGCGNKPYEAIFTPYVSEYIGIE